MLFFLFFPFLARTKFGGHPFALEEDIVSPLSMFFFSFLFATTLLPSAPPPFLALDQKLHRAFLCKRDMIYMRTNNSFQMDNHYRWMIEKFLAYDRSYV